MNTNDTFLKSFLQEVVCKKYSKDVAEDDGQQKYKVLQLKNTIKKRDKPAPKSKKLLTSRERKSLKLMKLKDDEQKYDLYLPLNQLWQEYMADLLNGSHSDAKEFSRRLSKSDFHGCDIKVTKSKCPNLIGVEGIVLLETKNVFNIITPTDRLKKIPKQNTVFEFRVCSRRVTLYGNNFRFKISDRSTKSFKTQPTIEL